MGRTAYGVRGISLRDDDEVVAMEVVPMEVVGETGTILSVTENGYGKRTAIDEYRLTARGAKGVKTIAFTESKGLLAAALVVKEHQDLVFISHHGMVQRTSVRGINRYGRSSQGVRVMNLREGDEVSAVALVVESDAPADVPVGEPASLDAAGTADEPSVDGDTPGVISAYPTADSTLTPPEVSEDDLEP